MEICCSSYLQRRSPSLSSASQIKMSDKLYFGVRWLLLLQERRRWKR
jgi:hypothetical protein